jgi:hypothetical protein
MFRDRGKVIALTHIELLVGCAIPVWIWAHLQSSPERPSLRLLPHLGWITVGIGDSAVCFLIIEIFALTQIGRSGGQILGSSQMDRNRGPMGSFFQSSSSPTNN